ncbi:MAG: HAMP domain-containing protein, partial [Myxococcales bacterium]|nr:HAMP domain-containing protein [Myxococcales bacterium]
MRLRTKLLLAQVPLVIALGITIVVGSVVTRALARGSENILKDNHRSVLAAQQMKAVAEQIDRGVVFIAIGRADRGVTQIDASLPAFEAALHTQANNITEPGERAVTDRLRAAWTAYRGQVAAIRAAPEAGGLVERYLAELSPGSLAVQAAADEVLTLNQDAMLHKSDRAQHVASQGTTGLIAISLAGLVLGLIASSMMTSRLLRPLGVLGQTARRLGEGDVAVRARVEGGDAGADEIRELARELNTMAERIQKYRQSSLGELLEAQLAAQATIDSLPDPVLVVALDGELRQANQAAEAMLAARAEAGVGG